MVSTTSLYIHWPFCEKKCPYCDFNSHVVDTIDYDAWLQGYKNEIELNLNYLKNKKIVTIFFGGGTPSLMPTSLVGKLLDYLDQTLDFSSDIEISLEANPNSSEYKKFAEFKSSGINRLSIGFQAMNDKDLKFLGRLHNSKEAMYAIEAAAKVFDNYNFDLIYARPNQTLKEWQAELEFAMSLGPKHLSLYQLTIEKGTQFYLDYKNKKFELPNEELSAELYELTNELTAKRGLDLYEISNYAESGFECKHNLVYWQYKDYLGIGPGAHTRITMNGKKSAIMNYHKPDKWLKLALENKSPIQENYTLTTEQELQEKILMGLRLKKGIEVSPQELSMLNDVELLKKGGYIHLENNHLRLDEKEFVRANSVIGRLL